jgi:hypothetical protein
MEENVTYEESSSKSVWSIGLKVGLIEGVILIVYNIISYTLGWAESNPIAFFLVIVVNSALLIFGIVYAHIQYKKQYKYMSYGVGLGLGVIVSLIAGLLLSIFSFVYLNYIDTEFMNRFTENSIIWMENKGADSAQLEEQLSSSEASQRNPLGILSGAFMYVFIGFFLSLIIAAITKKTEPIEDL